MQSFNHYWRDVNSRKIFDGLYSHQKLLVSCCKEYKTTTVMTCGNVYIDLIATPTTSSATSSHHSAIIGGAMGGALILVILLLILVVIISVVVMKKKKAAVQSFQLEVLAW